jgi:Ca-activated chloride channel family protein
VVNESNRLISSTTRDIIAANMPYMRILSTIAALGLVLSPDHTTGQSTPTGVVHPKINVAFFANDGHDQPVSGVTLADVAILDNRKAPQLIVGMRSRAELPLRLGILIDTSNSERASGRYQAGVQAASDFLNQVLNGTDDKVFIEKFDAAPNATQFMTKQQISALKVDLTPAGPTALFDALLFACDERMKNDPVQDSLRVVVLLSDGDDSQSRTNRKEAIAGAQRVGAVIFGVSTADDNDFLGRGSPTGNGVMKQFADETGGMAFLHLNRKDLPKVFAAIKGQIDNMHLLSYVPADPDHRGQYRSLELKPIRKPNYDCVRPRVITAT